MPVFRVGPCRPGLSGLRTNDPAASPTDTLQVGLVDPGRDAPVERLPLRSQPVGQGARYGDPNRVSLPSPCRPPRLRGAAGWLQPATRRERAPVGRASATGFQHRRQRPSVRVGGSERAACGPLPEASRARLAKATADTRIMPTDLRGAHAPTWYRYYPPCSEAVLQQLESLLELPRAPPGRVGFLPSALTGTPISCNVSTVKGGIHWYPHEHRSGLRPRSIRAVLPESKSGPLPAPAACPPGPLLPAARVDRLTTDGRSARGLLGRRAAIDGQPSVPSARHGAR